MSANPLVTPEHMVPEWYFLAFYAMLSSISNKVLGVILIFFLFMMVAFLPFMMVSSKDKFLYLINILSGLFVSLFMLMSFLGASLPSEPWVSMTRYLVMPSLLLVMVRFMAVEMISTLINFYEE